MKHTPRRGDIVHVSGHIKTVGKEMFANRPGLVVSSDAMNGRSGVVQVVYLRRNIGHDGPVHVNLGDVLGDGNSVISIAACEQVHAVDASRLGGRVLGHVDDHLMAEIDCALRYTLGLTA